MTSEANGDEYNDVDKGTSLSSSAKRGYSAQVDAGFDNDVYYTNIEEADNFDVEDQLLLDYLVYNLGLLPVQ